MHYLYDFTLRSKPVGGDLLERWAVTGYATAIAHAGLTFQPLEAITHSSLTYNSEDSSGQATITVPRDFDLATRFLAGYPYGVVLVTVYEVDEGVISVVYKGRVRTCAFNEQTADMTCSNGSEALKRLGLRINGGRQCQWALYSEQCGVSESANRSSGSVTSVSADGLTVGTTLGSGHRAGGRFVAAGQARMILSNSGGTLSLMSAIPGLTPGTPCTATRGCDHTKSSTTGCGSFNNILNFSGFEGLETPKNVFSEGAGD